MLSDKLKSTIIEMSRDIPWCEYVEVGADGYMVSLHTCGSDCEDVVDTLAECGIYSVEAYTPDACTPYVQIYDAPAELVLFLKDNWY